MSADEAIINTIGHVSPSRCVLYLFAVIHSIHLFAVILHDVVTSSFCSYPFNWQMFFNEVKAGSPTLAESCFSAKVFLATYLSQFVTDTET
jgi:hypothetical protein